MRGEEKKVEMQGEVSSLVTKKLCRLFSSSSSLSTRPPLTLIKGHSISLSLFHSLSLLTISARERRVKQQQRRKREKKVTSLTVNCDSANHEEEEKRKETERQ